MERRHALLLVIVEKPELRAADHAVVGHVMWAYDGDDGTHWIGGMLIDAAEQEKGVGRAALQATIRMLNAAPGARRPADQAVLSPGQHRGRPPVCRRRTGDREDDEVVVALPAGPVPAARD